MRKSVKIPTAKIHIGGGAERDESRIIFAIFAESNHICHSERSEESQTNNLVILSKAKYLKNNRDSSVVSLPQNDKVGAKNDNLRKIAESGAIFVDSANFVLFAESNLDSANHIQNAESTTQKAVA